MDRALASETVRLDRPGTESWSPLGSWTRARASFNAPVQERKQTLEASAR